MSDTYYVYAVVMGNQVVLDNIIEYNTWGNITKDWESKGLGVVMRI